MNPNLSKAIEVRDLRKVYNGRIAVDGISFDVHTGEVFGFLGPNGAGKTTTVRMLTGIIVPDGGSATILGHDVVREPVRSKQVIGVVPETANAYDDLTAWQNLMLMADLYGLWRSAARRPATDLLEELGLFDRRDQKVAGFSKGMRQRLILAMALLHDPPLLFLDEPTSGLDVQSTHLMLAILSERNRAGTTIFLTTHNMDEANRLCDRVGIIRAGRIAAIDSPKRLKQTINRMHAIEVGFDRPVEAPVLVGLPGIDGVSQHGDTWRLETADTDAAIASVVAAARSSGARILSLSTLSPTLDEVYLRLTGGDE
ncbi:ATP-binding protein [Methanoculleus taiwanensis]|uniref:ATP-binding protein n=1 Tax=Methanoculleus taiwanensis TaxID=1550565 RepID=A0A498H0N6_9EURY|nr:ATP-binding cassette domain-containing protein [Methanoculleus taiwanensis]RXE56203.1 ATP-binding protein [Methanoculleus taiwanensis]